jgi:hypothetical protein
LAAEQVETNGEMTMHLPWENQGDSSCYARDPVTGLTAQVDKSSADPAKPYFWFVADLPCGPPTSGIDAYGGYFDNYPDYHGTAATEAEARAAVEEIMPDLDLLREMQQEAEAEWDEWNKTR